MDYKNKYEQALERARIWKDKSGMPKDKQGILDDIFPELKENEDEKTKRILHSVSNKMSFHLRDIFTEEEFQCFDAWSNAWLEKQGEQKPASKVKPKFKVGDFILNGDVTDDGKPEIFKVLNVQDTWYAVENIYDGRNTIITFKQDSSCRIWDLIKDAKDGDVLALSYASRNYIQIYKRLYEEGFKTIMSVYCFYCVEEDTYYDETDSFHVMNRGEIITPATKEQREQLKKAISDAGYIWDAKEKQLKEVDSYCQEHCKGFQETGKCFADGDCKAKREAEQKPTDEEMKELLQTEYEKGRADAVAEMQKSWSEEDERKLTDVIVALSEYANGNIPCILPSILLEDVDWLKSLKDRVQPKQEWSEEEEKIINGITNYLCSHDSCRLDGFDKWYDFLKSLKDRVLPQLKQEWSKEDESLRRRCIGVIDMANLSDYTKDSLLNWLKSLSPQSRWKPSAFHLECIEDAISLYETRGINAIGLKEILDELKKLREE